MKKFALSFAITFALMLACLAGLLGVGWLVVAASNVMPFWAVLIGYVAVSAAIMTAANKSSLYEALWPGKKAALVAVAISLAFCTNADAGIFRHHRHHHGGACCPSATAAACPCSPACACPTAGACGAATCPGGQCSATGVCHGVTVREYLPPNRPESMPAPAIKQEPTQAPAPQYQSACQGGQCCGPNGCGQSYGLFGRRRR